MSTTNSSRRDFLKKTAYVAPLVLTMNVSLAEAQVGSSRPIPNGDTVIRSSHQDGDTVIRSSHYEGSRRKNRSSRGRGHAYGHDRRDDD